MGLAAGSWGLLSRSFNPHLDNSDPDVKMLTSASNLGPDGGRQKQYSPFLATNALASDANCLTFQMLETIRTLPKSTQSHLIPTPFSVRMKSLEIGRDSNSARSSWQRRGEKRTWRGRTRQDRVYRARDDRIRQNKSQTTKNTQVCLRRTSLVRVREWSYEWCRTFRNIPASVTSTMDPSFETKIFFLDNETTPKILVEMPFTSGRPQCHQVTCCAPETRNIQSLQDAASNSQTNFLNATIKRLKL